LIAQSLVHGSLSKRTPPHPPSTKSRKRTLSAALREPIARTRAKVGSNRRRKRQSPSPEYLRKRRPNSVPPELRQNTRLSLRLMCPRDRLQPLAKRAVRLGQGPRPICLPSLLRPPRSDKPLLVG
jgi:hypothetical protein